MAPETKAISRRARAALSLRDIGEGMIVRTVRIAAADVVFVKGILEASEGVAALFAERGGDITLVAPRDRSAELAELMADLERDVGAVETVAIERDVEAASDRGDR
jgi:hypothetical protein